jgi:hypothetical protein
MTRRQAADFAPDRVDAVRWTSGMLRLVDEFLRLPTLGRHYRAFTPN